MSLIVYLLILDSFSFEPKIKFIEAVMNQCKLSKEEATRLATPGRNGSVVRFALCNEKELILNDECHLFCKKEGAEL